jgi:hypothetical protein
MCPRSVVLKLAGKCLVEAKLPQRDLHLNLRAFAPREPRLSATWTGCVAPSNQVAPRAPYRPAGATSANLREV